MTTGGFGLDTSIYNRPQPSPFAGPMDAMSMLNAVSQNKMLQAGIQAENISNAKNKIDAFNNIIQGAMALPDPQKRKGILDGLQTAVAANLWSPEEAAVFASQVPEEINKLVPFMAQHSATLDKVSGLLGSINAAAQHGMMTPGMQAYTASMAGGAPPPAAGAPTGQFAANGGTPPPATAAGAPSPGGPAPFPPGSNWNAQPATDRFGMAGPPAPPIPIQVATAGGLGAPSASSAPPLAPGGPAAPSAAPAGSLGPITLSPPALDRSKIAQVQGPGFQTDQQAALNAVSPADAIKSGRAQYDVLNRNAGDQADNMANYQRIAADLKAGGESGPVAPLITELKSMANEVIDQLPISDAAKAAHKADVEKVALTENAGKLMAQIVSIGGDTDAGRALAATANANINYSRLGNQQVAEMRIGLAKYLQAKNQMAQVYMANHDPTGANYQSFDTEFRQKVNPLSFQLEEMDGTPGPDGQSEKSRFLDALPPAVHSKVLRNAVALRATPDAQIQAGQ